MTWVIKVIMFSICWWNFIQLKLIVLERVTTTLHGRENKYFMGARKVPEMVWREFRGNGSCWFSSWVKLKNEEEQRHLSSTIKGWPIGGYNQGELHNNFLSFEQSQSYFLQEHLKPLLHLPQKGSLSPGT